MPDNKNQHFVPRCHLKPFSLGAEGLAINLYNRRSDRIVKNAAVKGQCAKDYFYGRSLHIERMLQGLEGRYATIIASIERDIGQIVDTDLQFLRDFAFLQHLRTEAAVKRYQFATMQMQGALTSERRGAISDPGHDWYVASALKLFTEAVPSIRDLKTCFFVSRSSATFVTSDDPAIATNRLHLQRWHDNNFGWKNSGALLILPLTCKHTFVCYDGTAYTMSGKNGFLVELYDAKDVQAINRLQYLHCHQNIYFAPNTDGDEIQKEYRAAAARRVDPRHTLTVLVQSNVTNQGEHYRQATEEERRGKGPFMYLTSARFPDPGVWPACLKYRDPIRTHFNGSAAGHVRKKEWLSSNSR